MHFRLVTYNIHKGIGGTDRRYRLERVIETILHCRPDIAVLQEVDHGVPRSRHDRQVELIAEATGLTHYAFQRNVRLKRGGYGNAILSRFPLTDLSHIDLTIRFKKRRRALVARCRVRLGGHMRSVTIVNVHLGLSGLERQIQLRRLLANPRIDRVARHSPIAIAGDYNDVWGTLGKRILQPAGFTSVGGTIRTFPAVMPLRPLDRIYYRNLEQVRHAFACHTGLARQASDHLPLVAEVQFPSWRSSLDDGLCLMTAALSLSTPELHWTAELFIVAHVAVQLALCARVIMRRLSVGESLAWILVVFAFPVGGVLVYLLMGELRLGRRRARRFVELSRPIREWLDRLPQRHRMNWSQLGIESESLSRLGQLTLGLPTLPGNALELVDDWQTTFAHLVEDIDAAQETCHLEFYIWHLGGAASEISDALMRATSRGVTCRILVDAMGSRRFLRSDTARRMLSAGVSIQAAMEGGLLRMPFVRFDLRMHRKIVVIDGTIAYTGSLNLVDPRYFKRDSGVGQWIDAMVRVKGPAVEALAITFLADWYVESDEELDHLSETGGVSPQPQYGESAVQVLPSGPAYHSESIEQVLIMAVYAARRELVLTTPYFVPNESLRMALRSAAHRGVKVLLILPAKVDSLMVRYASRAFTGELLNSGVRVANFDGGLLHTKSVTVDGEMSLFGSLNLDPRSFRLNFEISLAIYDRDFTGQLRALQQTYIDRSELMDLDTWNRRPLRQRVAENCARLFGPLL